MLWLQDRRRKCSATGSQVRSCWMKLKKQLFNQAKKTILSTIDFDVMMTVMQTHGSKA